MNQFRAWGLSLALSAAATATNAAEPGGPPARTTIIDKYFGGSPKPRPAPKAGPKTFADTAVRPQIVTAPLPADVLTDVVRAEQDAYLRRLDVCTRLRQVAAEKNDDALMRQADELEQRATAVYQQRVARLGVKTGAKSPPEVTLDRELGSGAAVNPLTIAPPVPADSARAATAMRPGGTP